MRFFSNYILQLVTGIFLLIVVSAFSIFPYYIFPVNTLTVSVSGSFDPGITPIEPGENDENSENQDPEEDSKPEVKEKFISGFNSTHYLHLISSQALCLMNADLTKGFSKIFSPPPEI